MIPVLSVIVALFFLAFPVSAQINVIRPGDNLIVEGIPAVPASLADEIGRYNEFRSATLASWHPTKREMLITTRFAETNQVHRVTFPGSARTQTTFLKDAVAGASYQPTHGNYFIFRKDTDGNEFFQYYRFDHATGAITLLTDGKSRNGGLIWSPSGNGDLTWSASGDRIAYTSTRRNGTDTDIFVMDPLKPESDQLLAQVRGGGWNVLDWSRDNQRLLVQEYISVNESYLWIVEVGTGKKTLVTQKRGDEKVFYWGGAFSHDGNGIFTVTDRDSEFMQPAYLNLSTGQCTFLVPGMNWGVDHVQLALSDDGRTLAFVTNEAGISVLHILNIATKQDRLISDLPKGVISWIQWHRNGKDLGVNLSSTRVPGDVYSVNAVSGKAERWTQSETGGLNTVNFAEPKLIRWKSFDNREITGLLYQPPASFTGKRPVLIIIHGGPESQSRPGYQGYFNYFIHTMGIAVIFPNIRGSFGYGKTYLTLDNGILRENAYRDIAALLDWIQTRPELDTEKVMVTGRSYGGHMTLAISTFYSDRIRCALDIVGMSNLVTFLEHTESYRQDLRRVEYGDERDPQVRTFLEKIAPMKNLQMIRKPLFVVAGRNDPRVPASESEQIVNAVRQNGTPVWFLMAKNEGHGFAKKSNMDFLIYATALFMQEHLLK